MVHHRQSSVRDLKYHHIERDQCIFISEGNLAGFITVRNTFLHKDYFNIFLSAKRIIIYHVLPIKTWDVILPT